MVTSLSDEPLSPPETPGPEKSGGKSPRRKQTLVIGGLLALSVIAGLFLAVSWIDRKILSRVAEIRNAIPVPVLSAPLVLRPGETIPLFRVWHYLKLARAGGTISLSPGFDRQTSTLRIPFPGGTAGIAGTGEKGNWTEVAWEADDRIDSIWKITGTKDRVPLNRLTLPPLSLGSLQNGRMVEYRPVDFDHISPAIKTTFLLSEDRRFFESPALDLRGIGRAFFHDVRAHRFKEGGSTITQQVVKILFLNRKKSLPRKVTEAIFALRMAALLPPQDIFELYLNHIDLGGYGTERIVGVEAASLRYFGRHASQLGWKEAATLATLVRAPTYYSPFLHPKRTTVLRNHILTLLYRHRLLNQKQWNSFMASPLGLAEPKGLFHPIGPYFLDYIARQMREIPPPFQPEVLSTTMDPLLQEEADRVVSSFLTHLEGRLPPKIRKLHPHDLEGALVVLDPRTGAIRAMVGGRDFATSPLNRATRSRRQPASLFKIVPYLTALTPRPNGPPEATLATVLPNTPMTVLFGHKRWRPKNNEEEDQKSVLLYRALARSMNLPVLHLSTQLDRKGMVETARNLGLETPGPTRVPLSYPLGVIAQTPLQMAGAYARVANGGLDITLHALRENGGSAPGSGTIEPRLFPPQPVYLLFDALRRVLDEGTGSAFLNADPERDLWAGKTGTSNRGRDTWFVALSSREVVLAWAGFDDDSPTYRFGAQLALPIVSALVSWQRLSPPAVPIPPDIVFASIDSATGMQGDPSCGPSLTLPFLSGTIPPDSCRKTRPPSPENPILHFFRRFF